MSRAAAPLPSGLPGGFRISAAEASGASLSRLRAADLDSSLWGLRSRIELRELAHRCELLALRLPAHAYFTHQTAALLHGLPLPWKLEKDRTLHVGVLAPHRAAHANGIVGHVAATASTECVGRIRRTDVVQTWCDLADVLGLLDLVAAGDSVIYRRQPRATVAELRAAVDVRPNRRGVRNLRAALELLDDRAESPKESVLRTMLVLAGFPGPRVNHVVTDRFGEFVARTDLIFEAERLVLEYMGDYHRTTSGQWRADMTRRSKLEALGWRVIEINADDLKDPVELMARIRTFARLPAL